MTPPLDWNPGDYEYRYREGQPVHREFTRPHDGVSAWARAMSSARMPSAADTEDPTPCAACGGAVAVAGALYSGDWRLHPSCHPLDAHTVVKGVLAAHRTPARKAALSGEDCELLREAGYARGLSFATSEDLPRPPVYRRDERPGKPWSFVTKTQLAKLAEGLAALPSLRAAAGLVATTCSAGPCAWCGIRLSRGWASRGHHWQDGTEAPLCQGCAVIFDKYAADLWVSDYGSQRGALSEVITGVPTMMGEAGPDTLRSYAETVGQDRPGNERPWSHLDQGALAEFRWDRWGRFPRYAPPEKAIEARARWQRKERLRDMRRDVAAKNERERAQTYRF